MRSVLTEQILELEAGSHVGLFYDREPREQLSALIPFLMQGLAGNEQCIYVAADQDPAELQSELERHEVDVDDEVARGRLKVWSRQQWRQSDDLDPQEQADHVRRLVAAAEADGFAGIRFAIEMGWTREPDLGVEAIERWEATVNTLLTSPFPCRIICPYKRSRLRASVVLAGLHTHPLVIVDDELCQNVFFQGELILKHGAGDLTTTTADDRVEWMIGQLRKTRAVERQKQELGQQKRAQQRLALQWATNDIVSQAASFGAVGKRFLQQLAEETGWEVAGFWLIDHPRGRIGCAEFWQSPDLPSTGLESVWRAQSFICGVDLPGRVWLEAAQVWISDLENIRDSAGLALAKRAGLRSACAFPVAIGSEVIGVVELFSRHVRPRDDEVLEMLVAASAPVAHWFDRQRAQQKQRSSDERLRQLVSLLPAGIYTCDLEGRITFYNRRAVELWGREPKLHDERERFCGCYKLLRSDGRVVPPAQSTMAVALSTGKSQRNVQAIVERPDGVRFSVSLSADPIFSDEHGKISGAIVVFQDITELKRSENLLSGQNQALQLVISGAPLAEVFVRLIQMVEAEAAGRAAGGILLLDEDGRRLRHGAAPSLSAAYNAAIDGIEIGPNLGTCCAAAFRGEIVITPDIASEAGWAEMKHLPLELGFRAAWSMPILSSAGKVLGTFGTYFRECRVPTDQEKEIVAMLCKTAAIAIERHRFEAERKRAAEEIERARDDAVAAGRAKDDFLAALSHELRTPLSPVLLLASEAALDPRLPEGLRADFDTIRKNVELEARLIDDLLDLTRVTRGKLPIERRAVDAHAVLRDALATVRPEMTAKRIVFDLRLGEGTPTVWADPVRLQQIFWNVLKNAVKFTPEGGSVSLETRTDVELQKFSARFSDTGIGMSAFELTQIFDAFSQGEHAAHGGSHRFGGLGLGLAISRKLVELHGGQIRASSAGRDRGAEFCVELPLLRQPGVGAVAAVGPGSIPQRASAAPLVAGGGSGRPKILLVEDHGPTRATLEHLLRRRKYEVVSAATLAEARALAENPDITLVISDIGLPDGSGYDLMTELRARRGLKGIALSGYGMESDLTRSYAAGFTVHLTKPVNVQSLEQALEKIERVSE
jgi:signal transduction histidine kinase/CheY-like chemotaxis protein